jgi:hypothetical protein
MSFKNTKIHYHIPNSPSFDPLRSDMNLVTSHHTPSRSLLILSNRLNGVFPLGFTHPNVSLSLHTIGLSELLDDLYVQSIHPSLTTTDTSLTVPNKHHHLGNKLQGYIKWQPQAQYMGSVLARKYCKPNFNTIKHATPVSASTQMNTGFSTITNVCNDMHKNTLA